MDTDTAKAGWLHRQSSILHRWKKNWFILRTNGDLLYFESPEQPRAEERIVVRARVQRIKPGFEVNGIEPPEGLSKGCLFALDMRNEEMVLCAESSDDMRAWQIALEEARVMRNGGVASPPSYTSVVTQGNGYPGQVLQYPGQVIYPNQPGVYPNQPGVYSQQQGYYPPGTVIYGPDGTQTVVTNPGSNVVYVDGYPRRRYDGSDVAMGVVAGAALGSMMWGPVFWW